MEKHELEDSLPRIYAEAVGKPYPGGRLDDNLVLGAEEMVILRGLCGDDELHFQLTRELLDVERQHRTMARRAGLFKALEGALRRGFYDSTEDAEKRALERQGALDGARLSEPTDFPLLRPLDCAGGLPASNATRDRA